MSARIRLLVIAALGMAVPVLAGLVASRPDIGFTIGLGAMLLSGTPGGGSEPAQDHGSPARAVLPALLAVVLATLISGATWTDAAMIVLAGAAAAVSGYSRPLGIVAIRFAIYLVLSVGLLDGAGEHRGAAALIFGLGALWNIAIRMLLAWEYPTPAPPAAPSRNPTPAQRRAHWKRTMRTLAGWQFTLRLVGGLAVASLLRHHYPAHHYFWILLTVALLTQRPLERLPVKVIERAGGTLLGVALTWLILATAPPTIALAVLICLLGTAAPLVRAKSYTLYSAIATPVILLVIDWGRPIATALLTDRLVATLVAAAIVVAANLILDRLLRANASPVAA